MISAPGARGGVTMRRFELVFVVVFMAALVGCDGGDKPESSDEAAVVEAPAEVTPEVAVASDDDDSAGDDDDSSGDDDDSAGGDAVAEEAAAADDDDSATAKASEEGDVGADKEEPTSAPGDPGAKQTGKPDDPAPKPREEGKDAPYEISIVGSARTSATEGEIVVSVRGETDIANGIKWTTTGEMSGPKKSAGKEDSSYTWTVKGLSAKAAKGSITGAYGKWSQKLEWDLPASEPAPPPSPKEDPPAPE